MNVLNQELMELPEAVTLIHSGAYLAIAGEESSLASLPQGNWIGGTIPYFMTRGGGKTSRTQVFVTRIDDFGMAPLIMRYDEQGLPNICVEAPANGFSLIILPAFSRVHHEFAKNAPMYDEMYLKPLVGWISGVHLDDLTKRTPKTIDGRTGALLENSAVVMHVPLPDDISVNVSIINLFSQGRGDVIHFESDGFSTSTCIINKKSVSLARYLESIEHDTRLPLVADYNGAQVNVSLKSVNSKEDRVDFYGPVFRGVGYRLAAAFSGNYDSQFAKASADLPAASFSCNCVLNYLYGELEGKHTGQVVGPMTFGEIAYQLLNQTMVLMTLEQH